MLWPGVGGYQIAQAADTAIPDWLNNYDQTATPDGEQEDKSIFDDIVKNTSGRLLLRSHFYVQDPVGTPLLTDDRRWSTEARLDMQSWIRRDNFRLDIAGWLEYGMEDGHRWDGLFAPYQDHEDRSRPLVLNELKLTASYTGMDITAGKAIITNSVSTIFSPADRYSPYDFNDPLYWKRLGIWQLRLDAYGPEQQLTLALLPVFQPSKSPSSASRWAIRLDDVREQLTQAGITQLRLNHEIPDVSWNDLSLFGRWKLRHGGWDLFASAYYGTSHYAIYRFRRIEGDTVFVTLEHPRAFEIASGVSTTFGSLELHAESLYHYTQDRRDDEYLTSVVGGTWRFLGLAKKLHYDDISVTLEYAGEWMISELSPQQGLVGGSEEFRIGRNLWLGRISVLISGANQLSLDAAHDPVKNNSYLRAEITHRWGNGITLGVAAEQFSGNGLYFGEWNRNDRLTATLEYNF